MKAADKPAAFTSLTIERDGQQIVLEAREVEHLKRALADPNVFTTHKGLRYAVTFLTSITAR